MARADTLNSDITAIRADLAQLAKSIGRIQAEMNETRGKVGKSFKNGANGVKKEADHAFDAADDLMNGALKLGSDAVGAAGEAVHAGTSWIDDMLRKNPTPAVLAALGVGFLLGVMGRR
jgi:ElaB/YqjD/DUF883 family membrane-anchored ribosome-binding protein